MNWLNQLERKLYRLRVQPFIRYILLAMTGVYVLDMLFPTANLYYRLSLLMPLVYRGEVWRLLTFLILPPAGSMLTTLLHIYFYYFIGTTLEQRWGTRRFLLYYVLGAVGAILAAVITGMGTNYYLYMSMFFATAIMNPEAEILLFFVLPIKMKWLALLNAAYFLYSFIVSTWSARLALLFSILNVLLFFGGDMLNLIRNSLNQWRRRRTFRNSSR